MMFRERVSGHETYNCAYCVGKSKNSWDGVTGFGLGENEEDEQG